MPIEEIKQKISVVIQGPIDDRTYEAIDCYQDFAEVIVSTWSEKENYSLLYNKKTASVFKLITSNYIDDKKFQNAFNQGSILFMAQTMGAGAKAAKSEYVLKIRSDELYPNLNKFLENFSKYPDRLHTTNNGFWKLNTYSKKEIPFSLSNHLILDKKEVLEVGSELIVEFCLGNNFQNLPEDTRTPEQLCGVFLIAAKTGSIKIKDWKKIFKENVFITPCIDLPGHLHSGQSSCGRGFKRSTEPYPCGRKEMPNGCHDSNCLYHNIDEIEQ